MWLRIDANSMSKREWIVFGSVCLGVLFSVAVLVARHMISNVLAVVVAIGVCGFGAILTVRSKSNNTAQGTALRRLVYIYAAFGLLAAGKALTAGWTTDDTIGLTTLLVILTVLGIVIVLKQRKNPSPQK
jgi:hypothetical protein